MSTLSESAVFIHEGGAASSNSADGAAGGNVGSVLFENSGLVGDLSVEQGIAGAFTGTGNAGPGGTSRT